MICDCSGSLFALSGRRPPHRACGRAQLPFRDQAQARDQGEAPAARQAVPEAADVRKGPRSVGRSDGAWLDQREWVPQPQFDVTHRPMVKYLKPSQSHPRRPFNNRKPQAAVSRWRLFWSAYHSRGWALPPLGLIPRQGPQPPPAPPPGCWWGVSTTTSCWCRSTWWWRPFRRPSRSVDMMLQK
jgi:hypothetical protein